MTTYIVKFSTQAESGSCDIDAETLEQALQLARKAWGDNPDAIVWEHYCERQALTDITILNESDDVLLEWIDPEESVRLVAAELLEALELCEDALSELARLDDGTPSISALGAARAAITKAKPPHL
jgi:hypothetical protein